MSLVSNIPLFSLWGTRKYKSSSKSNLVVVVLSLPIFQDQPGKENEFCVCPNLS